MGPDSANLAASVAKSLEVERSPSATQRASEVAQDQLASEAVGALSRIRPDAAESLRRARIKQERERRRRELERYGAPTFSDDHTDEESGPGLDVMV